MPHKDKSRKPETVRGRLCGLPWPPRFENNRARAVVRRYNHHSLDAPTARCVVQPESRSQVPLLDTWLLNPFEYRMSPCES
jgi:hypothetical protein